MVNKVNTEQFNELMKEDAVLVDFSATWCGPCKMLAPIMASVSEKLAGKCKVVSFDVDESSDLAEKFGTKVKIANNKLEISFVNSNDLNRILEIIGFDN